MKTPFPIFLSLASLLLAGCPAQKDDAATAGAAPLRVGMEAAYPPFESVNKAGEFEGFDVDLARAIGESLERPVEFKNMAFDSLPPELEAGRIDLICSGMSYTDERAKKYDFSKPYARSVMSVLVGLARAKDVTKLPQLDDENVHIAVQRGTTGETKAKEAFPKAKLMLYETEADAAREVASGRLHAFVYDCQSVEKFAKQYPDTTRVLAEDLGTEEYCIVFAKGSPLREKVNAYLDVALKPGGKLEDLRKKWGLTSEKLRPGTK